MAVPRELSEEERVTYKVTGPIIVTDDDPEWLAAYNCLGFAVGVYAFLGWPVSMSAAEHLKSLGFHRRDEAHAPETVLALYGEWPNWHVAKRLRGGLYESKCGDKLRIIHLLHDVERAYGQFNSLWVMGESSDDLRGREDVLRAEAGWVGIDQFAPVDDSGFFVNDGIVNLFEKSAESANVDWWSRYRAMHPPHPVP
jgi:hypothetical protein